MGPQSIAGRMQRHPVPRKTKVHLRDVDPDDTGRYAHLAVAQILVDAIDARGCKYPPPVLSPAERKTVRL